MDNDVTPVYLAAQEGHLEVLKYLVMEAGGSLYVRAKDGMAPVHAASQMGCLACLKWMIQEQGVDPNLRDGDGATPLHFAASRGHVDTVRWLLRHGARLVLDKYGKSPINDAAENQQMECLNILVQHGTAPDYTDIMDDTVKLKTICTCFKEEPDTRCSSCVTNREPFFLHPPSLQPPQQDGLYINPAHNSSDPFFLHNPRDVVYNRVKDLFEPSTPLTVKVEVHTTSSDENLSSSDLSERSADPENDYEEIYQLQEDKTTACRRSHDSGSHSRSGSSTSSNSRMVIEETSPDLEPVSMLDTILNSYDEDRAQESGVSSGSQSDIGHSEEECEKTKVSHRHSLPHLQHANNTRALKRVVSEPGTCPPPPPPPPPVEESASSSPPSPEQEGEEEREEEGEEEKEEVVEEPTLKPSELVQRTATAPSLVDTLVNKQMVLPFVPPRFPSGVTDSNCLIKPSEYLRSLGGSRLKPAPDEKQPAATGAPPPPPPQPQLADTAEPVQQQPLGSISIQDLNSVQLRRTDKMQAAKTLSGRHSSTTGEQPFLVQKDDLIAELKLSKDITGIKKMKVERAKVEEQQEKEMFSEITKQLTANSFVEKIPDKDATGNPIPAWKRQMMAKKAAERARKELEEQMLKEAEEKRLQSIPPWKRQLLAKKEENDGRKTNLYTPRVVDDKKSKTLKPEEVLRQQNPASSETNTNSTPEDSNKENKTPLPTKEGQDEEVTQIIPWRAQLRKTNSKLSLLE